MYSVTLTVVILAIVGAKKNQQLQFKPTPFMIPHPQKAYRGGQDAFHSSSDLLVVADGVGGWNNQGIDPSLYSRFLCAAANVYYHENPERYSKKPIDLIVKASQTNKNVGSSTMLVATIDKDYLKVCNIGDCKLLVFRVYQNKTTLIYESIEQQHSFNYPFQLAMKKYGGDDPYEAVCSGVEVRPEDIVLVGSDGLFDNIYIHEIRNFIQKAYNNNTLTEVPKQLAKLAIERGQSKKFVSPFQKHADQQGLAFQGGKLDDTTVIIAEVINKDSEQIKNQQM